MTTIEKLSAFEIDVCIADNILIINLPKLINHVFRIENPSFDTSNAEALNERGNAICKHMQDILDSEGYSLRVVGLNSVLALADRVSALNGEFKLLVSTDAMPGELH